MPNRWKGLKLFAYLFKASPTWHSGSRLPMVTIKIHTEEGWVLHKLKSPTAESGVAHHAANQQQA